MKSSVFLFLLGCFILSSCADGVHTSSWKAKGVNLKGYKSYAWMVPGDTLGGHRHDDKLYAGSIQKLSDVEIQAKGMVVDTHQPDVLFMFDTRLEDHVRYTQSPQVSVGFGVGSPGYYGGPGYYMGGMVPVAGGEVTANYYKQGSLIIEMYDFKTQKVVWRGWAKKDLDNSTDMDYTIRKAVHDIFIYLPIKHKPGS